MEPGGTKRESSGSEIYLAGEVYPVAQL